MKEISQTAFSSYMNSKLCRRQNIHVFNNVIENTVRKYMYRCMVNPAYLFIKH